MAMNRGQRSRDVQPPISRQHDIPESQRSSCPFILIVPSVRLDRDQPVDKSDVSGSAGSSESTRLWLRVRE